MSRRKLKACSARPSQAPLEGRAEHAPTLTSNTVALLLQERARLAQRGYGEVRAMLNLSRNFQARGATQLTT